jgi:hypothetical protein
MVLVSPPVAVVRRDRMGAPQILGIVRYRSGVPATVIVRCRKLLRLSRLNINHGRKSANEKK